MYQLIKLYFRLFFKNNKGLLIILILLFTSFSTLYINLHQTKINRDTTTQIYDQYIDKYSGIPNNSKEKQILKELDSYENNEDILKEYQKNRIRVFLDPELDPFGAGYHVIQSKIAIGSGLLTGKGWFLGTQSQLNFLPENHTDFIFAVAGEEFGFIGIFIILLLYLIVIWRGLTIALNAEDDFGTLLAVGITFMFMFHVLVNIGMTAGIMPVTGVPLPFMSYGVSSLTTNMLLAGLLLNINMRRQQLQF